MKKLKAKMKKSGFRWTADKLKLAFNYKKRPKDEKMPTLRADLLLRYQETKGMPSPQVSPANSDDEGESDDDDDVSHDEDQSDYNEASDGKESESEVEEDEEEDVRAIGLEFSSNDNEASKSEGEEYSDDD